MEKEQKTRLIQLGLFIVTLITTTLAGTEWMYSRYLVLGLEWADFLAGFSFSIPFLGILTVHEFGHYFTARYHQIKVSLPYYIPMWFGFMLSPSLGTMGAFIRIREHINSRKKYFDVGVSGPIAGFVVAIFVLWYGFASLPETEYIYEIHPEYELFGENFEEKMEGLDTLILKMDLNPARKNYEISPDTIRTARSGALYFGDNILMNLGRKYLAPDDRYVPSSKELMHYPWLLAGYLAFFFTALNLLPIGQLDGGHVIFGLLGQKKHAVVSRVLFTGFVFYASLGWVSINDLSEFSNAGISDFLIQIGTFLLIVYFSAYTMFKEKKDRLLYATILLTAQFLLNMFTGWEGYNGWLAFAVIIGRFMGVDHPPAHEDDELSMGRKIIGWVALVIFILCFSPQPLVVELPELP
ncbi:MAG: site-2 protease family protein [Cyclobacteriaceae bacterium]